LYIKTYVLVTGLGQLTTEEELSYNGGDLCM